MAIPGWRRFRDKFYLAGAAIAAMAVAQVAAAQSPGGIRYRVVIVDSSGRAVPNAHVRVADVRDGLTDGRGLAILDSVPPGAHELTARAIGYIPGRRTIAARSSATDTLVLARLGTALDTVHISAADPVGFGRRLQLGHGQFITAADIEREHPKNTTSLLRTRDGLRYTFDRVGNPFIAATAGPRTCRPTMLIDGFPFPPMPPAIRGVASLDRFVAPEDIGGVEIYNNPASVPATYVDARSAPCGAIVFWTREKLGLPPRPRPPHN